MTRLRTALATSLLLCAGPAAAQDTSAEVEPLVTDRPDFTESTVSADPGEFQLELGATITESGRETEESVGELLLRIGLTHAIELRVGLNSYVQVDQPAGTLSGLEDASLGVKIELTEEPLAGGTELAVLLATSLPTGSSEVTESEFQPEAVIALGWELAEGIELGSNLGVAYGSSDDRRFLELITSLALGFEISEQTWGFTEVYGFTREAEGGPDTYFFDAGLGFLFGLDLQLDARAGVGLNSDSADWFAGIGLSKRWR